MNAQDVMYLILLAPGAILAIALHEAMHGYVAHRLGDPTAKILGRLTLNPFKHVDLFGTFLVPALLFLTTRTMFGWAKPVPVNVMNLNNPKRDMAYVAAAGPGANLGLALIASALLYLVALLLNFFTFSEQVGTAVLTPLILILIFMLKFNLGLMMFNLLPIPPLDGGRILVGVLPHRQAAVVAAIEPYGFYVLIFLLMLNRATHFLNYFMLPVTWMEGFLLPEVFRRTLGG